MPLACRWRYHFIAYRVYKTPEMESYIFFIGDVKSPSAKCKSILGSFSKTQFTEAECIITIAFDGFVGPASNIRDFDGIFERLASFPQNMLLMIKILYPWVVSKISVRTWIRLELQYIVQIDL